MVFRLLLSAPQIMFTGFCVVILHVCEYVVCNIYVIVKLKLTNSIEHVFVRYIQFYSVR